jgi:hypothetical protein
MRCQRNPLINTVTLSSLAPSDGCLYGRSAPPARLRFLGRREGRPVRSSRSLDVSHFCGSARRAHEHHNHHLHHPPMVRGAVRSATSDAPQGAPTSVSSRCSWDPCTERFPSPITTAPPGQPRRLEAGRPRSAIFMVCISPLQCNALHYRRRKPRLGAIFMTRSRSRYCRSMRSPRYLTAPVRAQNERVVAGTPNERA